VLRIRKEGVCYFCSFKHSPTIEGMSNRDEHIRPEICEACASAALHMIRQEHTKQNLTAPYGGGL
jgi:hypothetical protein